MRTNPRQQADQNTIDEQAALITKLKEELLKCRRQRRVAEDDASRLRYPDTTGQ